MVFEVSFVGVEVWCSCIWWVGWVEVEDGVWVVVFLDDVDGVVVFDLCVEESYSPEVEGVLSEEPLGDAFCGWCVCGSGGGDGVSPGVGVDWEGLVIFDEGGPGDVYGVVLLWVLEDVECVEELFFCVGCPEDFVFEDFELLWVLECSEEGDDFGVDVVDDFDGCDGSVEEECS